MTAGTRMSADQNNSPVMPISPPRENRSGLQYSAAATRATANGKMPNWKANEARYQPASATSIIGGMRHKKMQVDSVAAINRAGEGGRGAERLRILARDVMVQRV
jgi:hypothetical protein